MFNKNWFIPLITIYVYSVTILVHAGFTTYFGIHSSFIESSMVPNVIFFRKVLGALVFGVQSIHLYVWVFTVGGLCLLYKIFSKKSLINILYVLCAMILILFAYNSHKLGENIASTQTSFMVIENCKSFDEGVRYIIPQINGDIAPLVQIDSENKIIGGFLTKNLSQLNCKVQWTEIGNIKR